MNVTIDSNALTYLLEAMDPAYEPSTDDYALSCERLAMIRSYFYAEQCFYILPQVVAEYRQIKNEDWRMVHEKLVGTLLLEVDWTLESNVVKYWKEKFLHFHSKEKDCQILAEAKVASMDTLLTRDNDFINRLGVTTNVCLLTPSHFWNKLGISKGSPLKIVPRPTNPLYPKIWWRI